MTGFDAMRGQTALPSQASVVGIGGGMRFFQETAA